MGKILQILIIENRDFAHAQTFCTRVMLLLQELISPTHPHPLPPKNTILAVLGSKGIVEKCEFFDFLNIFLKPRKAIFCSRIS